MDNQNIRDEIIRRSKVYKEKQRQRTIKIMEGVCSLMLLALVAVVGKVAMVQGGVGTSTYYATLLLGKDAGAYILVGIICFILGALVTLIAVKKREDSGEADEK